MYYTSLWPGWAVIFAGHVGIRLRTQSEPGQAHSDPGAQTGRATRDPDG